MKILIKTIREKEIIDITEKVERAVQDSGLKNGICNLFVAHTTAAITTADLDPGTDLDMIDAFNKLIPNLDFRHPHNPKHAPDHILASLIGVSVSVPVQDNALVLGTWQRIVLIEFATPREREVVVTFVASL